MARRRKSSTTRRVVIVLICVALIATGTWFGLQRMHSLSTVSAERADSGSEGRKVKIAGKLEVGKTPTDLQLGISVDAAILFRHVEMYEWLEHCQGDDCRYDTGWSSPVDSSKFKRAHGNEQNPLRDKNPPAPFADATFVAGEIHVGAVSVDPELVVAQLAAVVYPVHAVALPPNLAATFREVDGVLYAGGDPARPKVGELQVSYRIVPLGNVSLTGVRRGAKLSAN